MLLREIEICNTLCIGLQPRAIGFILRQTGKRDQRERDVVGAFMGHPVAEQIASAFRNDGEPPLRVGFKHVPLKRIELVADENGNGHGMLLVRN